MHYLIAIKNLNKHDNQLEIITDKRTLRKNTKANIVHLLGEYSSAEAALFAAQELADELHETDHNGAKLKAVNPSATHVFRPHSVKNLTLNDTILWLYERIKNEITADTTNEELHEFIDQCKLEAKNNNRQLHDGLEGYLKNHRFELGFSLN